MQKHGRAGIATFVMRGKEYLVAIVAENGLLRAETLRFSDEIRSPEDAGLPGKARVSRAAVREFEQTIKRKSVEKLPEEKLKDAESQRLLEFIQRKQESEEDVIRPRGKHAQPNVVDLLEVLRQALAKSAKPAKAGAKSVNHDNLDDLSKADLLKRAAKLKIRGRSSMTRAQLIDAVQHRAA
jgi:DNA end-binding protein Ku